MRLAIIEYIPLLASQLGADFFEAKLGPQVGQLLGSRASVSEQVHTGQVTVTVRRLNIAQLMHWALDCIIADWSLVGRYVSV